MKRVFLSIVALMCMTMAQAQPRAFKVRSNIPTDSIRLSDPAILADQKTKMYYMTGTGGMMWRSADLKLWEGPFRVTEFDANSWMGAHPMIWAAELHQTGDGFYYYFATFTNQAVKIDTVRGNVIERRASQVLRADNPMGPYRAFGDATYLPANRPTLDGTFWRDTDGTPYMVFCGEWLQNWNGTIEKIELSLSCCSVPAIRPGVARKMKRATSPGIKLPMVHGFSAPVQADWVCYGLRGYMMFIPRVWLILPAAPSMAHGFRSPSPSRLQLTVTVCCSSVSMVSG